MSRLLAPLALLACHPAATDLPDTSVDVAVPEDPRASDGVGTVRLLLHDAPSDDVQEVHVAWDRVEVATAEDAWLTLSEAPAEVDLLALVDGLAEELALADLPVGDYTEIRLHLTDAWVVVDGAVLPLDVPSGFTSGLKLKHDFTVPECGTLTLSLDWDVGAHFQERGNGTY
ncbi:MAG: DUF4382 domain-containing protein, partial [Alphaproteobacteria bacterium]|nr:DUF4382 domain-containing protein [Alphaproteobacteria bacterium]